MFPIINVRILTKNSLLTKKRYLKLLITQKNQQIMPHSTTKSVRTKRLDTRPNGKNRAKVIKKQNGSLKIQDIRVTRVAASEKKDRTSQPTPLNLLSKDEKLLRALKKKLKGIQELISKQELGVILDNQQKEKIAQLDSVLGDIEVLVNSSLPK